MSTYVISDIHCQSELFYKMLKKINFQDYDELYILGDILDRGVGGIKLLQEVLKMRNVTMLMGNHEQNFLDEIKNNYGHGISHYEFNQLSTKEQTQLIDDIDNLPLIGTLANSKFILCHAGIETSIKHNNLIDLLDNQDDEFILWAREAYFLNKGLDNSIIISGHTPTAFIERNYPQLQAKAGYIWKDPIYNDKYIIDCGAPFFKRLGCLRLNDMKEFYV